MSMSQSQFFYNFELIPGEAIANHGVDQREQLSHAGDDSYFDGFAGRL